MYLLKNSFLFGKLYYVMDFAENHSGLSFQSVESPLQVSAKSLYSIKYTWGESSCSNLSSCSSLGTKGPKGRPRRSLVRNKIKLPEQPPPYFKDVHFCFLTLYFCIIKQAPSNRDSMTSFLVPDGAHNLSQMVHRIAKNHPILKFFVSKTIRIKFQALFSKRQKPLIIR